MNQNGKLNQQRFKQPEHASMAPTAFGSGANTAPPAAFGPGGKPLPIQTGPKIQGPGDLVNANRVNPKQPVTFGQRRGVGYTGS